MYLAWKNNIFIAAFTTTWEKQEHECAFVTASVWWGVGCQNVGAGDSEVSVGSRPSSSCFTLPVTPRVAPRLPRESAQRNRNQSREASPLPRHVVPDLASGSEPLRKSHPQGEGQRKPGVPWPLPLPRGLALRHLSTLFYGSSYTESLAALLVLFFLIRQYVPWRQRLFLNYLYFPTARA